VIDIAAPPVAVAVSTSGRMRVLRALATSLDAVDGHYVAARCGTTPGHANDRLNELANAGYVEKLPIPDATLGRGGRHTWRLLRPGCDALGVEE